MSTRAYAGYGTRLLVDSELLEQVQTIMIDHAHKRLRARVIYRQDAPTQERVRSLGLLKTVHLRVEILAGNPLDYVAEVLFCRTRIDRLHAIRSTVEFKLS